MYRETELEKEQQKEQELYEHRILERRYKAGKVIIITIALINIISFILLSFIKVKFFTLAFQFGFSIALLCGAVWARYIFAIGATLGIFYSFYILIRLSAVNNSPKIFITAIALYMIYCVICSILLFTSKSVTEFFYRKKYKY